MTAIEYGVKTGDKGEKEILKIINKILADEITNAPDNKYKNNQIKKTSPKGGVYSLDTNVRDSDLFDFTYFYFNKYWSLTIELYPNKCKRGLIFDEDGITWNLFFLHLDNELILCDSKDLSLSRTNRVINKIIEAIPYEGIVLKKYEEHEDRVLGNII